MNSRRVALVTTADGSVGSGYLVGGDLVLTARHVVVNHGAPSVWLLGPRESYQAEVVWPSVPEVDACLLRLTPAPSGDLGLLPVAGQFGRSQAVDWECSGFPDAAREDLGDRARREAAGGLGVIAPGGGVGRRLELCAESGPRTPEGWKGLSGSAVFAQGYLVGVMQAVPTGFDGRRLYATPIEDILKSCGQTVPGLEKLSGSELPIVPTVGLNTQIHLPPTPVEGRPAALLVANRRAVAFQEEIRMRELAALDTWCATSERLGIQLLVGPGGSGKTRFLIEYCCHMRRQGWHAGFLTGATAPVLQAILKDSRPALIAIDYAEVRPELGAQLADLAQRVQQAGAVHVRVVLLARHVGDWWPDLTHHAREDLRCLLEANVPFALAAVTVEGGLRQQVFEHAWKHLGLALGKPEGKAPTPPLDHPAFERVLFIHLAALATHLGLSLTAERLLDDACDYEERLWLKLRPTARAATVVEQTRQLVSAIILRGGAWREYVEQLAAKLFSTRTDSALVEELRDFYPGQSSADALPDSDAQPEHFIAPIEPDLLAEAMVQRSLAQSGTGWLDQALAGATSAQLRHAFVVLGRMAQSTPADSDPAAAASRAVKWIAVALDNDTDQRCLAAFQAARVLAESPDTHHVQTIRQPLAEALLPALEAKGSVALAAAIEPSLPEPSLALAEIALWATHRLLRAPSNPNGIGDEKRARLLNNLGFRLSDVGRREEALDATSKAIDLYRGLAKARPDVFLPVLAGSLANLGNSLSGLGRREEALLTASEAVAINRRLAEARPNAFLHILAMSLNNLGNSLSATGQREKALDATSEAVDIRRRLARVQPDAFLPVLAGSLNNLGNRLSDLGRREDALQAVIESVEINRRLTKARPDAFLPDLAMSLNNLGNRLSALGRREDAVQPTSEAVEIYRGLAKARPDAFLPDLAMSLNNLGNRLSALGRRQEALLATKRAVNIRRDLAKARPDAFLPDLATSLNNLGNRLSVLGRREEALLATSEAVNIRRGLARERPDAFLPDLASSLNNLGSILSQVERCEEALQAASEAADYYRGLAKVRPDAFLPDLATSLNNLGTMLWAGRRREEALLATSEAVDIRRDLANALPDAFLPTLVASLKNLSARLSDVGRREEALQAKREAEEAQAAFNRRC